MYYRVAIRQDTSPTWQWKSTTISSLNALLQFLRRFHELPQDHLRVFSSSSHEEMDEQLAHENNGLGSHSVTAAQFMQARMISPQPRTALADAPSARENADGMYPASRSVAAEAERKTASRSDFWNLMALAKA